MALKDLGEKGIVDPYPPLVDIKGKSMTDAIRVRPNLAVTLGCADSPCPRVLHGAVRAHHPAPAHL